MKPTPKPNDGSLSIGDMFLQECAPKNPHFFIEINSIKIKCKVISDSSEIHQIRRAASEFAQTALAGKLPGELKKWAPTDGEIAARAYMLTQVAIEPKITQLDALKIAKGCGIAFELMMQAIDQTSQVEVRLSFHQEIEEQKKDSSETPSD